MALDDIEDVHKCIPLDLFYPAHPLGIFNDHGRCDVRVAYRSHERLIGEDVALRSLYYRLEVIVESVVVEDVLYSGGKLLLLTGEFCRYEKLPVLGLITVLVAYSGIYQGFDVIGAERLAGAVAVSKINGIAPALVIFSEVAS